ncbi:MAG: pyruvate dehydrogenase [Anaerolineales bacterium]|nr:MAG: pyruvate dehydrogenase [Anaerolineales bacterium]
MQTLSPNWLEVAHKVLLSRKMDSLEIQQLTPQGKIKYQFSAMGHELAQVLLAQALDHPHDGATVYYRSRPFMLARGMSAAEALAAGMARAAGPSGGRDTGVMFNLPGLGKLTVLPTSGNVGAQYSPAAGWAQSIRYHTQVLEESDWNGAMAVAIGGEGSVAANGFWAALNIVTTMWYPYLFFIEDNEYGLSVPSLCQTPGGDIAANLAVYENLKSIDADGTDPAITWQAIQEAVQFVRVEGGPCLLRVRVPRLLGHTFVDTQAYKSAEQLMEEASRDPLPKLQSYLLNNEILDDAGWQALENQVDEELQEALREAESTPEPDPATALKHVYYEGESPLQGGLRPMNAMLSIGSPDPEPQGARINLLDAVRRTLEAEMSSNPRILVFGEDVGVKGGVHGATQGMQTRFGVDRVFDTSLNEDGIIGRSTGMAAAGLLPVPEIQFRKYADPAHEQLSDLGTLRWRTQNHFAAPVVVRMPVGYAKKTGDPWHSVSGEAVYAHFIGWRIAYPSNAEDAVGLLRTALRGDDPTFFFEHRALLDSAEARRPYPGDNFCLPFGVATHLLQGDELTIISWGAMVHICQDAARDFTGRISLLDLRTILPWDVGSVLEDVQRTGKALVVHEDTLTNGFAAEIIATINEQAFTFLDAPVRRITAPDIPVPYNINMMNAVIPNVTRIKEAIAGLLAY